MNALTLLLVLAVPLALVAFWLGVARLISIGAQKPVVIRLLAAVAGVLFLVVAVLEHGDNGRSPAFLGNAGAAVALLVWALVKKDRPERG